MTTLKKTLFRLMVGWILLCFSLLPTFSAEGAQILPLPQGGTGVATATKGSLLSGPGGANAAAYLQLTVGTDGQVLTASSTAQSGLAWAAGGTGSPGGSNTQLQFNNSGSFGGISQLTWSGSLLQNTATTTLATTTISQLTVSNLTSGNCVQAGTGGLLTTAAAPCGSGSGSGNSAWTVGNGLIYNATSTDLVGIGTVTPATTLYIQGKGGTNPFTVASSTGTALLTVTQNGSTTINSLNSALPVRSTSGGSLFNGAVDLSGTDAIGTLAVARLPAFTGDITSSAGSAATTLKNTGAGAGSCTYCSVTFDIQGRQTAYSSGATPNTGAGTNGQVAYYTAANTLSSTANFLFNGTVVGFNATSSTIGFNIQGTGGTNDIFNAASSTGTSVLKVTALSRVGINSSTPQSTLTVVGNSGQTYPLLTIASSTNTSLLTVSINNSIKDVLDVNTTTPVTTQAIAFIQGTSGDTTDILRVASSTGTSYMKVDANGHIHYGGTAPSVSSCGTNPSVTGNDVIGDIVTGTAGPTACTLTFAAAYTNVVCVLTDDLQTSEPAVTATSTTAITITLSAALTSHHIYYNCADKQ